MQEKDEIAAVALLDEPMRRWLYEYVIRGDEPVGRDEAAAALGIRRELAAFHLDKLTSAGLLRTEYRRLTGRSGPGAGRPAKVYRRGDAELQVTVPHRDYRRAAGMFAEMLEAHVGEHGLEAVSRVAWNRGREAGSELRERAGTGVSPDRLRAAVLEEARSAGYEPRVENGGEIGLCNCPYASLARAHTDVTCAMNFAWFEGFLEGVGDAALRAVSRPVEGRCCVELHPRT